jgi:ribonucleotide monophosphatase NagD (HAD superfamily)
MSNTIFCDIDGTLVHYNSDEIEKQLHPDTKLCLTPGTKEKLSTWIKNGDKIILTTGRKESVRKVTEKQLSDLSITYDQLIMGVVGKRYLINDRKEGNKGPSCTAITVDRNEGIGHLDI